VHQPPFICAIMYLAQELQTTFPHLTALLTVPEDHEDEEEEPGAVTVDGPAAVNPHQSNVYDARKRDPEHANAQATCLWEIVSNSPLRSINAHSSIY
jgi:ribosome biogenesis protein MAK21